MIRELDAHTRGAGVGVERRVDVGDATGPSLTGERLELGRHRETGTHRSEVLLEHLAFHPHDGQIGHPVQRLTGHDPLACQYELLDHHTADRRSKRERPPHLARTLDLSDLSLRDVPVREPPARRAQQLVRAANGVRGASGDIAR